MRCISRPVDPKAPNIEFALAVPTAWNQQAWQFGGNGFNGFVPLLTTLARGIAGSPLGSLYPPHVPFPITEGFATYGDDSGHGGVGGPWNTFRDDPQPKPPLNAPPNPTTPAPTWMDNDEAFRNFGHEHIKKDYDIAFSCRRCRRAADARYFGSESRGAALMAATRHNDFDGVMATSPIAYLTRIGWRINRTKVERRPAAGSAVEGGAIRDEVGAVRRIDGLRRRHTTFECYRSFDGTGTPRMRRAPVPAARTPVRTASPTRN